MEFIPSTGKIHFDEADPDILQQLLSIRKDEVQAYRKVLQNALRTFASHLAEDELTEQADDPTTWSPVHEFDHRAYYDHQLAIVALDGVQAEFDLETLSPYEADFSE